MTVGLLSVNTYRSLIGDHLCHRGSTVPHERKIAGEEAAIQLAALLQSGRIDNRPVAVSLLHAWSSDTGWTERQAAKVRAIVFAAQQDEGEAGTVTEIAPTPYERGGPWQHDTRPERQAVRGVKSGLVRRWGTRHRDREIVRFHRVLGWSIRALARWYGLARSTVAHILHREPSMRARVPPKQAADEPLRTREMAVPAKLVRCPGSNPTVFASLLAWLGLGINRDIGLSAVIAEARRLNIDLGSPMKPPAVARLADRALQQAQSWRD